MHKGATLWLLHFFMKHPTAASPNARIRLRSELYERQKEGTVRSYCEAVYYVIWTYATDVLIAEKDTNMMHFTQPSHKSPTEYAKTRGKTTLRFNGVHDEYVLKRIFTELL